MLERQNLSSTPKNFSYYSLFEKEHRQHTTSPSITCFNWDQRYGDLTNKNCVKQPRHQCTSMPGATISLTTQFLSATAVKKSKNQPSRFLEFFPVLYYSYIAKIGFSTQELNVGSISKNASYLRQRCRTHFNHTRVFLIVVCLKKTYMAHDIIQI